MRVPVAIVGDLQNDVRKFFEKETDVQKNLQGVRVLIVANKAVTIKYVQQMFESAYCQNNIPPGVVVISKKPNKEIRELYDTFSMDRGESELKSFVIRRFGSVTQVKDVETCSIFCSYCPMM